MKPYEVITRSLKRGYRTGEISAISLVISAEEGLDTKSFQEKDLGPLQRNLR